MTQAWRCPWSKIQAAAVSSSGRQAGVWGASDGRRALRHIKGFPKGSVGKNSGGQSRFQAWADKDEEADETRGG